jgi:aldehyde dehydrogenase (NAD+)
MKTAMPETLRLQHAIAAQWAPSAPTREHRSPYEPDDLVVLLPEAGQAEVDTAVAAAVQAVPALHAAGIEARSDALARIGARILAEEDALALLIARETGKTLRDARGEVVRAARIFAFFAGEALRNVGERFESTRRGAMVEVARDAVGVVGLITPWNFPIAIPAWKMAPALAFGNAVVWKPSELSSATAAELMAIVIEVVRGCGLPAGSVNMLLGAGDTGRLLCAHRDVTALSFTGSEATGARVRDAACARNARVQLEMGGINGLIVLADANLDLAVECALNSAFFSAGQRCTAASRLIVDAPVLDDFLARLRTRVAGLVVGDPRDPATDLGPLVDARQKRTVLERVDRVLQAGARLVIGDRAAIADENAFVSPLLFADIAADNPLNLGEIFGPVAGLYPANGLADALDILNGSRYGLSAGLCTSSLAHAETFKRDARAGMLMVNLPTAGVDYHAPFGGLGDSSYGHREQGRAARDFYTTIRTVYQHPG